MITNRQYTHGITRYYSEKSSKRQYVTSPNLKQRHKLISSGFSFSLNPLLDKNYLHNLSFEDYRVVLRSDPRSLWLLVMLEGMEFNGTAIKPCTTGNDSVEITGKTVSFKKLMEAYSKEYEYLQKKYLLSNVSPNPPISKQDKEKMHFIDIPKCIVVNDDRIPSLPVYKIDKNVIMNFFKTVMFDHSQLFSPKWLSTLKSEIRKRKFKNAWSWQNRVNIVPYDFLDKVIFDLPCNVKWRGIYRSDFLYDENDAVSHPRDQLFYISCKSSNNKPLSNNKSWKLCPQKVVKLLQVVVVMPIAQYNAVYGIPKPTDEPFTFIIGDSDDETKKIKMYDSPETVYFDSSVLYDNNNNTNANTSETTTSSSSSSSQCDAALVKKRKPEQDTIKKRKTEQDTIKKRKTEQDTIKKRKTEQDTIKKRKPEQDTIKKRKTDQDTTKNKIKKPKNQV